MWNDAYLEGKILSADPVELVRVLYEAALDRVGEARKCLAGRDIAGRSAAISKAMDILIELAASLNHEKGGAISRNLAELYSYMQIRLVDANVKQADQPLAETQELLATLLEGWQGAQRKTSEAEGPWAAPFAQPAMIASENRGWTL
jgi:flagellar protein FliS